MAVTVAPGTFQSKRTRYKGHAGIALPPIVFRSRVQFQRSREGFHGAGVIGLVGFNISTNKVSSKDPMRMSSSNGCVDLG